MGRAGPRGVSRRRAGRTAARRRPRAVVVRSVAGRAAVFYAGIVALSVAWLALGRLAITTRQLRIVGAAWCLPLLLTAPLFSQDAYSYLAQGTLVHLGIDPYRHAPAVLANVGQAHVLGAVDPFWRHTTAPYGPLFLGIVSVVVAVSGSHLVLGVLLIRLLALAGLVLLAVFVPRLARALGADPARATWWVLSPLVLLELVAGAHNDLLMIGLLVAGVTFAIERRLLLGVALCALAATIKLPAAAAIVFIASCGRGARRGRPSCAPPARRSGGRGRGGRRGQRRHRPRARVDLDHGVLDPRQGAPRDHAGDRARVDGRAGRAGRGAGPRVGARRRRVRAEPRARRGAAVALAAGEHGPQPGDRADRRGRLRAGGVAVVSDLGPRAARRLPGDPAVARARARGDRERAGRQGRRHPRLPAPHRAGVRGPVRRGGCRVAVATRLPVGRPAAVACGPGRSSSPDGHADRGPAGPGA